MVKKNKKIKIIFTLTIVILLTILGFILKEKLSFANQFSFDKDELFVDKNRVLMDSVPINDTLNLYYFNYSSGVFGSSIGFLVLEKNKQNIHIDNAFLESAFIYNFKKLADGTILIKVSENEYKILKNKIPFKLKVEGYKEGELMPPGRELYLHLSQ